MSEAGFLEFLLSLKRIASPGDCSKAFGFDRFAGHFTNAVSAALDTPNCRKDINNAGLGSSGSDERKATLRFLRGALAEIINFDVGNLKSQTMPIEKPVSLGAKSLIMFGPAW